MSRSGDAPKPKSGWRNLGRILGPVLTLAGVTGLLGYGVWGLVGSGDEAPDPTARFTAHGWAALILGVVMVALVAAGLMRLAFYSASKGYDERVESREE
jgi:hypothetical protein